MRLRSILAAAVLAIFAGSTAFAAEQTWSGKISDSNCGAKHAAGEHDKKMTDADCVKSCVKSGAKYVFVHEGKVLSIENQDFADLEKHSGHSVKLTGEMTGDTIKVSKIEMPAKKAPKKAKKAA